MSIPDTVKIEMKYGLNGEFQCEIPTERLISYHQSPAPLESISRATTEALKNPLELPPLNLAVVPGDKLTIAIDFQVPTVSEIINAVWDYVSQCGIDASDVTILQTQSNNAELQETLRQAVAQELQDKAQWVFHDPEDQEGLGYLGTSTGGERIYLSKHLLEADFILPIELVSFDPLIGYAGGGSCIYPGFSSQEAIIKSRGQSHRELTPNESRPLRQLIDEVAWMLGLQYSPQVIPAGGLEISAITFGSLESTFRKAKSILDQTWKLEPEYKSEMVVIAVENGPAGHHWNQLGRVLETARNLVTQDGRVVLLTQIDAEFGAGMQILAGCHEPLDAIKPLRDAQPGDLLVATQMALTGEWALLCLLSQSSAEAVEDLFIIPLEDTDEVERLLQTDETVSFIASAQHAYGQLKQD